MNTTGTPSLRARSIQMACTVIDQNPVFLDTETTGLKGDDEIIEISIIDNDGTTLFDSLIRPVKPIPPDATAIHGISNADVKTARQWPVVWPEIRAVLFSRLIVIYNQEFDLRMMQQTHAAYRMPWKERFNTFDLMKLYAEYRAEWDPRRRAYRYQSLDAAGKQCGISLPNAHRAAADTQLTRAVLHHLGQQTG
jgi:DNA polymerase III subunit epsilon